MTPDQRKVITRGFARLSALEFKRREKRWCRVGAETTTIVELQKSRHGSYFYVNVGVVFRGFQDIPCGPSWKTHVYGRWADERVERALSFDVDLDDDERVDAIALAVDSTLEPLLKALLRPVGALDMESVLTAMLGRREAWEWLTAATRA